MAEPVPLPTPQQTVTVSALLISLMSLCKLYFALGLIACVEAFSQAFLAITGRVINWIPFFGPSIERQVQRLAQAWTNKLGALELKLDARYGGYFHNVAIALGQLMDGEAEAGWTTWLIAKVVHATRATVSHLPTLGHVTRITKTVYVQAKAAGTKAAHATKVAAHAAPGSLVRAVGALSGELGGVIEWDLPRLRSRAKKLEGQVDRLWRWTRAHPLGLGTAAATALVTAALARLGVSWIRCSNWKRVGREVCASPVGDISGLLALLGTGAVVADFRELVKLGQQVEHGVATVLQDVAKV